MKHCSVIIAIYGLLYVGAMIGITISNQNINIIALMIISLYLAYVLCIKFKVIFHNKTTFFETVRSKTLYGCFKKALFDDSNANDTLFKMLHMMMVAGISLMIFFFIFNLFGDGEKLGPFGDFLGGVLNPIFTLMTFFGVIVTIALQKIELKAAREEYTKSANALSTQAIENTFFNMLSLHHKIVEKLNTDVNHFSGTIAFLEDESKINTLSLISGNLCHGVDVFSRVLAILKQGGSEIATINSYRFIQENHNVILGHYFRNLYQIMKFIHENDNIDDIEKRKYMSILRAQLSTDELAVLYVNCTSDMVDNGEFRSLLVNYQMLEHMKLELRPLQPLEESYVYYTSKDVIIADQKTINTFRSKINNGAFGKNKAEFLALE